MTFPPIAAASQVPCERRAELELVRRTCKTIGSGVSGIGWHAAGSSTRDRVAGRPQWPGLAPWEYRAKPARAEGRRTGTDLGQC